MILFDHEGRVVGRGSRGPTFVITLSPGLPGDNRLTFQGLSSPLKFTNINKYALDTNNKEHTPSVVHILFT